MQTGLINLMFSDQMRQLTTMPNPDCAVSFKVHGVILNMGVGTVVSILTKMRSVTAVVGANVIWPTRRLFQDCILKEGLSNGRVIVQL